MSGRGIYTLAEAAQYTSCHPQTVRSWFSPRAGMLADPIFLSDYGTADSPPAISFLDLMDISVAHLLRNQGVAMAHVRLVYSKLQRLLGTKHAFSSRQLYLHDKKVFVKLAADTRQESLVEVLSDQSFIEEVMRPHLHRIEYSTETELAARWNIHEDVVLDPERRFGEPILKGTRIPTLVLAQSYFAEDRDANLVAEIYGVTARQVENAVDFEEGLKGRKKAA